MKPTLAGIGIIGLAWALLLVSSPREPRALTEGDRAPRFEAIDVRTGAEVTLDRYEDQVVLLNLWATWCAPCREELPAMQRLHERLGGEGLHIVALSLDDAPPEVVGAFADRHGVTFDVLQDPRQLVERDYRVSWLPQSYIIDRDGRIASHHIGAEAWDGDFFVNRFRALLPR